MSSADREIVRVRDVMSSRYLLVDGLMTVREAIEMLRDREPCPFIVKKRWPEDEYGMMMLGDIAKKVLAHNRSPERVNVYEVMVKPLVHVRPEMDIRYCARLFDRLDLSHAPVLDGDELVGLVSIPNIVLNGLLPALRED